MSKTALVKIEPLPTPTIAEPTPKWPDWLETLGAHENFQPDPATGEWGYVQALTPGRIISADQRLEIVKQRDQMVHLTDQTPDRSRAVKEKVFLILAKLMLAMPARVAGPEAAEARIDAYLVAVSDVPGWAVDKAVKRWYRGACDVHGSEHFNYSFAPSPADLRRIAWCETGSLHKPIARLNAILSAVPLVEACRLLPPEMRHRGRLAVRT
jgi:hypothetical protein